jgi:urea transport system substrate-binding protein
VPKENIEEEYTPFSHQDYQTIVGKIKRFSSGGGACVLSTINGDSNVPFYKEFANQGLRSENAPIMAYSVAEDELRGMDTSALVGHLARGTTSSPSRARQHEVRQRVQGVREEEQPARRRQARHRRPDGGGLLRRPHLEAGGEKAKSVEVDAVRKAVYGQTFAAPVGTIKMHEYNQHTYRPCSSARSSRTASSRSSRAPRATWSRSRGASTRAPTRA